MARAIHGVRILIVGGAGIGAFYAAAQLAGSVPSGDAAIVTPALRPSRAAPSGPTDGHPCSTGLMLDLDPDQARRGVGGCADATATVAGRAQPPAASAPRPAASAAGRPDRSDAIPGETGPVFASLSWVVAPPPPPKRLAAVAAPPAAPVAPPLPFAFVGLVEKGTPKPQAFLSRGEELLVVAAGDLVDGGTYRVETVDATQIVFVHLPTKTRQAINLSGGSQ